MSATELMQELELGSDIQSQSREQASPSIPGLDVDPGRMPSPR